MPSLAQLLHHSAALATVALLAGCKPAPTKPFGAPCESPFDCESTDCNRERGGFCSKACKADSECGPDYVCAGQPTGTGASCAKKQGAATGTPCSDRKECDHGTCLTKTGEKTGFCSQRCITTADCPAHYKDCETISDMGSQALCLPGDTQPTSAAPSGTPAKPAAPTAPAAPPTPTKKPGKK